MTTSLKHRVSRLEGENAEQRPGLADRIDAAFRRAGEDPERRAHEDEKAWIQMQRDFAAGRLHGLGLRVYEAYARKRERKLKQQATV